MLHDTFDASLEAIINPSDMNERIDGFPKVCVSCFSQTTFDRMVAQFGGYPISDTGFANLTIPIYQIDYQGVKIALVNAYVGAAGCVSVFEDIVAKGATTIVLFGSCGILDEAIEATAVVIPDSAIRDEGTSYHYAPPSIEIAMPTASVTTLRAYFEQLNIPHTVGKVWTTDGIYRETVAKMKRRKQQGCICVDMECSAMIAWATFRQVALYQFFYSADKLSEVGWEARTLSNGSVLDKKDTIAGLAVEFAYSIVGK